MIDCPASQPQHTHRNKKNIYQASDSLTSFKKYFNFFFFFFFLVLFWRSCVLSSVSAHHFQGDWWQLLKFTPAQTSDLLRTRWAHDMMQETQQSFPPNHNVDLQDGGDRSKWLNVRFREPNQCFQNMHKLHNLQIVALYLYAHTHRMILRWAPFCAKLCFHINLLVLLWNQLISREGINWFIMKDVVFFLHQESVTLQLNQSVFLLSPPHDVSINT